MRENPLRTAAKGFMGLLLAEGIFVSILGLLIVILPQITTFALSILLSIGLVAIGLYKFINSIILRKEIHHAWLSMIIGILMVVTGAYLTMNPFFNILVLTMAIGIYFILEGINSITIAIQKKQLLKYWWVTLFSAIIQFLLAFIIIFGLPATALWTIGILIGVNMLFSGISLISIYLGTRGIIN